MSCQQRDMDLYLLQLHFSSFVSETRLTVAIQHLVCLANLGIKPELYPDSFYLLKTWSISIFQLTYIICFLGLVLLLLSACWRDSSWVSRFSSCCALQKSLTERWESYSMSLILSPKLLTICHPTSFDPSLILSAISPTAFLLFFF